MYSGKNIEAMIPGVDEGKTRVEEEILGKQFVRAPVDS